MPKPNDILYVWDTKGLHKRDDGSIASSEDKYDAGSVTPQQALKVLGRGVRSDHYAVLRLEDEITFDLHPNHYDPTTAYSIYVKNATQAHEARYIAQVLLNRINNP